MIERFKIDGGVNEYAKIIDPIEHEDEREKLTSEGYMILNRYKIKDEESQNYGKTEELWFK